jgi:hypothetical protein
MPLYIDVHNPPLLRIAAASAAAAALCLAQAVTASACDEHDPAASYFASARSSTAKYHSLSVAKKAGYSILAGSAGFRCLAEPGMGATGMHYVKDELLKDPAIDAKEPEALVYAPDGHGGLHLAALEYVVIQGDWNAHHIPPASLSVKTHESIAPPMLFGHEFNFTDAPNRYGLPPFYSLHVWLWKENPAGTLEMWNPNVRCDPPALGRRR